MTAVWSLYCCVACVVSVLTPCVATGFAWPFTGPKMTLRLVPFGGTNIRISAFPWFQEQH
eukprot:m.1093409 g.1093409  ORF g.1093409 m.1093409 type:complete len:60 (+) comp24297_c0_seq5:3337-3516(+)